jgi:urease accessory protein
MQISDPIVEAWKAELALGFERRPTGTVLAKRAHFGPLRVQKALYPEGPEVCHTIVLHPPSGIAGGDELEIGVQLGANSHALLTTPGAGKWYRSTGALATQTLRFDLAENSVLEWLPQETIVFNAALANMRTEVALASGACFFGQEVICLGRRAMNERFDQGHLHLGTDIRLGDQLLWHERGQLEGDSMLMRSPTGLAGFSVSATLLVAGREIAKDTLAACREKPVQESEARHGLTALPNLLVARYLGHSSEAAKAWFADLWTVLRPALIAKKAEIPRIWST